MNSAFRRHGFDRIISPTGHHNLYCLQRKKNSHNDAPKVGIALNDGVFSKLIPAFDKNFEFLMVLQRFFIAQPFPSKKGCFHIRFSRWGTIGFIKINLSARQIRLTGFVEKTNA